VQWKVIPLLEKTQKREIGLSIADSCISVYLSYSPRAKSAGYETPLQRRQMRTSASRASEIGTYQSISCYLLCTPRKFASTALPKWDHSVASMCLPSTRKNKKRLRPQGIHPEPPDEQPNYVQRSLGTAHTQDPISRPHALRPALVTQGRDEVNSSDTQSGGPESHLPRLADEPEPAKAVQDNGDQSTAAAADSNYHYTKQQQRHSNPNAALHTFAPAPMPPARLFSFEGHGDFYGTEPSLEVVSSKKGDAQPLPPPTPPWPWPSSQYLRVSRPLYYSGGQPASRRHRHATPLEDVHEVGGGANGWRFNMPSAAPKDDVEKPVRIRKVT
jgi:hypothetical protein